MRLLTYSVDIPTRKDHLCLQWADWLHFVSATQQRYVFDKAARRPHILKRSKRTGPPGRNHLTKSFQSEEDLIKFLRRNATELLKAAYLLQRDAECALALCTAEGHDVVLTAVDVGFGDHRSAKEAHDAHWNEAERRFKYLWPEDLSEAARIWREEAAGAFPPKPMMSTGEFLARARAASLLSAAIDTTGAAAPPVRSRLLTGSEKWWPISAIGGVSKNTVTRC